MNCGVLPRQGGRAAAALARVARTAASHVGACARLCGKPTASAARPCMGPEACAPDPPCSVGERCDAERGLAPGVQAEHADLQVAPVALRRSDQRRLGSLNHGREGVARWPLEGPRPRLGQDLLQLGVAANCSRARSSAASAAGVATPSSSIRASGRWSITGKRTLGSPRARARSRNGSASPLAPRHAEGAWRLVKNRSTLNSSSSSPDSASAACSEPYSTRSGRRAAGSRRVADHRRTLRPRGEVRLALVATGA